MSTEPVAFRQVVLSITYRKWGLFTTTFQAKGNGTLWERYHCTKPLSRGELKLAIHYFNQLKEGKI